MARLANISDIIILVQVATCKSPYRKQM